MSEGMEAEPVAAGEAAEVVGVVDVRPGLAWTLLTRADGFILVLGLVAAFLLVMRALSQMSTQISKQQRELLELRAGQARQQQEQSQSPAAAAATAAVVEEVATLGRRCEEQARESALLRQRAAEAEQRAATKADELEKLYTLLTEGGDQAACASSLREELREVAAREAQSAAAAQRAREEAEAMREHALRAEDDAATVHKRARDLEAQVMDLTRQLRAAEQKAAQAQTVWDMVVQQYGQKPDIDIAFPTPRTASPARQGLYSGARRSPVPGSSPFRERGSPSLFPAPPPAASQSRALAGFRRTGSPQPVPHSPGAGLARGAHRRKWYNRDDDPQTEYLASLEEQIESLQAHMDARRRVP
eukprot:Hpha_TRINITY_DN12173_c0_g2::TRINITY_DN12173_c0_g2_i1::g.82088::m.82088